MRNDKVVSLLRLYMLVFLVSASSAVFGKDISLTPFYGHQFGGNIRVNDGELQIDDTENMGLILDIPYASDMIIQLLYIYQDTSLQHKNNFLGATTDLFDLTIEYFHVGGKREIKSEGMTSFVTGSIGATYFKPDAGGFSDETLFSISFGMGAIKEITKNISVLVQGRILMPIQFTGGGIFCGNGGCSANISGGTNITQADITAGVQFRF